jgi:hypothetical protein
VTDKAEIKKLIDDAVFANSPHIDLGPLLGLPHALTVKAQDLRQLADHKAPTFSLSYDGVSVSARPENGGAVFTLGVSI